MPLYEYQCDACEHNFDEFQSIKDEPLKKCPKCRKNKLRRVFGAGAAILFKGSGFYETDYRRPPEKKADGEAAKTESKPETKSDSTSASSDTSASTGSTTAPAAKTESKGGAKKKT